MIKDYDGTVVEKQETYKGLHCVVLLYDGGWRCGYVALPKGHPLSHIRTEKAFELFGLTSEIHGGITLSDYFIKTSQPIDCPYVTNWWLGFDNHHGMDGYDFKAVGEHWGMQKQLYAQKMAECNGLYSYEKLIKRHCASAEETMEGCHKIVDIIERILEKDKDNDKGKNKDDTQMERD